MDKKPDKHVYTRKEVAAWLRYCNDYRLDPLLQLTTMAHGLQAVTERIKNQ